MATHASRFEPAECVKLHLQPLQKCPAHVDMVFYKIKAFFEQMFYNNVECVKAALKAYTSLKRGLNGKMSILCCLLQLIENKFHIM